MHDLFRTRIHVWPISVCLLRGAGRVGRPCRGGPRKHTADVTLEVGGLGIHWQIESRPTDTRAGAPEGFSP
ncbi:MAG: hypothetical protein PHV11_07095 [Candidatus Bipolaricaulis sp.]|nr:hypothetical protein [Candidatus Bipolaricaulis sp.]